jgi:hypothetical protein
MRLLNSLTAVALTLLVAAPSAARAQAHDPSDRLREVLPADVAARVLERIADARAHELPADALEQRALKFAARGVNPADIERSVAEQATRMAAARAALESTRGQKPSDDEVEAGAEAIRQGVDASGVSELAKSAPSGRSLAVPLYVLGNLAASGMPAADALQRVRDRLAARATDDEMEKLPAQAADAVDGHRPAEVGRDLAATKSKGASAAAGPPRGVPANGGAAARPAPAGRPPHPGRPNRP